MESFRRQLIERFPLTEDQVGQIEQFVRMVSDAPLNLTAWKGTTLWELGVMASLDLRSWLMGHRMVDVGTGGGFPGMILAIARPDVQWVLVDSRVRRTEYLVGVVQALGLDNVRVICARAEDWVREEPEQRGSFETVTVRAVGTTPVSVELGLPLLSVNGRMLLVKGIEGRREVEQAVPFIEALGGVITDWVVQERGLLVVVQKRSETAERFPRVAKHLGNNL